MNAGEKSGAEGSASLRVCYSPRRYVACRPYSRRRSVRGSTHSGACVDRYPGLGCESARTYCYHQGNSGTQIYIFISLKYSIKHEYKTRTSWVCINVDILPTENYDGESRAGSRPLPPSGGGCTP